MTGAYIRIQRNGIWQPIEIDQLTDGELDDFAETQSAEGWKWAKFLAKWIRDNIIEAEKDVSHNA